MSELTNKERDDLANNLRWHFACHADEPKGSYASLGIENAVLRVESIVAAREAKAAAAERERIAQAITEAFPLPVETEAICTAGHDCHAAARFTAGVMAARIARQEPTDDQ